MSMRLILERWALRSTFSAKIILDVAKDKDPDVYKYLTGAHYLPPGDNLTKYQLQKHRGTSEWNSHYKIDFNKRFNDDNDGEGSNEFKTEYLNHSDMEGDAIDGSDTKIYFNVKSDENDEENKIWTIRKKLHEKKNWLLLKIKWEKKEKLNKLK